MRSLHRRKLRHTEAKIVTLSHTVRMRSGNKIQERSGIKPSVLLASHIWRMQDSPVLTTARKGTQGFEKERIEINNISEKQKWRRNISEKQKQEKKLDLWGSSDSVQAEFEMQGRQAGRNAEQEAGHWVNCRENSGLAAIYKGILCPVREGRRWLEQKRVSGMRLFPGEGRDEKKRVFLKHLPWVQHHLHQWPGPRTVQEAASTLAKWSQIVNPALMSNLTPDFPPHQPAWSGGRMGWETREQKNRDPWGTGIQCDKKQEF